MFDDQGPLLKRILRQGWDYRWLVLAMLALTGVVTALTGYQGKLFKDLIDALTLLNAQADAAKAKGVALSVEDIGRALVELRTVALWMIALAVPTGLAGYGAWVTGKYLANRCMRDLRTRFVGHLVSLELGFHQDLARGELLSRVTADLDRLYSAQDLLFGKMVQRPALALGYVGAIYWVSWQVGVAITIILIPISLGIGRIFKKTRRRAQKAQETLATTLSAFEQITAGIRVIKSMGSSERESQRYADLNRGLFADRQRLARAKAQSEGITQGSVLLMGGVAMFAAAVLFERGVIQPSQLLTVLVFVGLLIGALREIQRVWGDVLEYLPSAARVYELIDRGPALVDAPSAPPAVTPREAIRLEGVSFRYKADAEDVVHDIHLTIPVGRVTALVGPSGGGKSTILDLIPRLRDVTAGRITWDGVDVRDVQADSLIHQVAIVNQDSFLFNDTIRNNIRYGRPEATEDDIIAAARRAHVHDAILALEGGQGYDTVVGDRGGRLSGGQRQRVAIARALLRDAPILLLDEPTSALDAESERHVQAALDELMQGRTVVVIAHRLATVQHAHHIHVIGKGADGPSRVLESGTHADLVARDGHYAGLVRLQTLG